MVQGKHPTSNNNQIWMAEIHPSPNPLPRGESAEYRSLEFESKGAIK
jgi:hypothetical protein